LRIRHHRPGREGTDTALNLLVVTLDSKAGNEKATLLEVALKYASGGFAE